MRLRKERVYARKSQRVTIKGTASLQAEDPLWGMPESPEFSLVQRLINEFKTHESDEERWLSIYKKIADKSDDPLIRFLLNLIIADEERHHQVISGMITGLKDDLGWTRPEKVVTRKNRGAKRSKELLQMVERFLEAERTGIKECEKLSKVSERFHQELCALLCRTMVHDSAKHIDILDFLRLKLRESPVSPRERKRRTEAVIPS